MSVRDFEAGFMRLWHSTGSKTRVAALLATFASASMAPGAALASAPHEPLGRAGIVVHTARSTRHVRAFWTPARIQAARPLPAVRISRARSRGVAPAPTGVAPAPGYVPPAGPRATSASRAGSAVEASDTGNPTHYPYSANGLIYGDYHLGGQDELYQCSGSVINSLAGDAVLTAGHCVIDPDSGTQATHLMFMPGYRDGLKPFGEWPASGFATTSEWESAAGTNHCCDESGDMAMLQLESRPSDSATVQSVVGALGIGFGQPRNQTYTQLGYPAERPYDGSRLFGLPSPLAFADNSYSPAPMGIKSDFTPGSSGGPWIVGSAPVALSITAYFYRFPKDLRGYMFGPYFGSEAQSLYGAVGGGSATATSTAILNVFSIMGEIGHPRRGTATLQLVVPGPGRLIVSGAGVRRRVEVAHRAGRVNLAVASIGRKRRALKRTGSTEVNARIRFHPTGGRSRVRHRSVTLVRRSG